MTAPGGGKRKGWCRNQWPLTVPRIGVPVGLTIGLTIGLTLGGALDLVAHPVSLTTAQLTVGTEQISLRLEVMPEDLVLFHEVGGDAKGEISIEALRKASSRHEPWLLERFVLLDDEGMRLSGKVVSVNTDALVGDTMAQEELMEHRVVYHFEFPLHRETSLLTVVQRFSSDRAVSPSMMDLSVMREGRWIHRPVQLMVDQPLTVSIAVDDSSGPATNEWEAMRRRREAEVIRRLGLASYSSIYSFIYVTAREVRHEVLIPLLTFEEWLPIDRKQGDRLLVAEQQAALEPIARFFQRRAPVRLNEAVVLPEIDQIRFFGVETRDLAGAPVAREVNVYQARLGVILRYRGLGRPDRVEIPWEIFGKNAAAVQSQVFVRGEAPRQFRFWKGNTHWRWAATNPLEPPQIQAIAVPPVERLRIPLLGLLCLMVPGAIAMVLRRKSSTRPAWGVLFLGILGSFFAWDNGQVSWVLPGQETRFNPDTDGKQVARALLTDVYQAFNQPGEDAAYDRLSRVMAGSLLEPVYLRFREMLTLEEQGGAIGEVHQVDWTEMETTPAQIDPENAWHYSVQGRWTVVGQVEHWGHLHQRQHTYRAKLRIRGNHEGWRIVRIEVLDQSRGPVTTRLRQVNQTI